MCPEGFRVYGPGVAKGRDATKDAPTPWQSLLLQTVLQGFLGLLSTPLFEPPLLPKEYAPNHRGGAVRTVPTHPRGP
jgi:hypothetical protein